jgi:hypothetical protein
MQGERGPKCRIMPAGRPESKKGTGAARKLDVLASIGPKVVCYAGSGHDGNKNLRDRDPNEFVRRC